MMNLAVPLFEQLCWCYSSRFFRASSTVEMEQVWMMTTGCKSTLSRKARTIAKANTKTRKELAPCNTSNTDSNTDSNTCKHCGRTGHWGERLPETRWRSTRQQHQQQEHEQGQEQQERQRQSQRQTVGRGANEPAFRNSLHRVVSLTDTEHHRRSLVQSRFGAIPTCNRKVGS